MCGYLVLTFALFQNVHVHIVDMSSPRQVWEFANVFSQSHSVHVLVSALLDASAFSIAAEVHCVHFEPGFWTGMEPNPRLHGNLNGAF